jgi:hypothetical protein
VKGWGGVGGGELLSLNGRYVVKGHASFNSFTWYASSNWHLLHATLSFTLPTVPCTTSIQLRYVCVWPIFTTCCVCVQYFLGLTGDPCFFFFPEIKCVGVVVKNGYEDEESIDATSFFYSASFHNHSCQIRFARIRLPR